MSLDRRSFVRGESKGDEAASNARRDQAMDGVHRHERDRREFLRACSAGAVAVAAGSVILAETEVADAEEKELPIVDTHQHLWDLDKFRLPWLDGAPDVLKRSYVTKDFLEATKGLNVVRAVYMEVDVAPEQQTAEAEHLLAICEAGDSPTVGAVISGRPNSEGFRPYILKYKDDKRIKGVRQVLHAPSAERGLCLQKQFVASVRLLGELGKSFDLCMRPGELSDGVKLAEAAPDTRLIVDHCGNADPKAFLPVKQRDANGERPDHDPAAWRRDIDALAARDNVVCKISGIVARVPKDWDAQTLAPIVNHCLDAFGPKRVVFGGDWPVCLLGAEYRQWVAALKQIIAERPVDEQRALLHDNAVRLYGLS